MVFDKTGRYWSNGLLHLGRTQWCTWALIVHLIPLPAPSFVPLPISVKIQCQPILRDKAHAFIKPRHSFDCGIG